MPSKASVAYRVTAAAALLLISSCSDEAASPSDTRAAGASTSGGVTPTTTAPGASTDLPPECASEISERSPTFCSTLTVTGDLAYAFTDAVAVPTLSSCVDSVGADEFNLPDQFPDEAPKTNFYGRINNVGDEPWAGAGTYVGSSVEAGLLSGSTVFRPVREQTTVTVDADGSGHVEFVAKTEPDDSSESVRTVTGTYTWVCVDPAR